MSNISVVEALSRRHNKRHLPRSRDDGLHIGLAVEGGGMRGIASLGMLLALKDLGLLKLFDSYVGISAGNFNLTAILSGHADSMRIYYESLVDSKVIDMKGILPGGRSVIDHDALRLVYDQTLAHRVGALINVYGARFSMAFTDLANNKGLILPTNVKPETFRSLLNAGATIPYISSDKPLGYHQHILADGGIYFPHPLLLVEQMDYATHVLVLQTKSARDNQYSTNSIDKLSARIEKSDHNIARLMMARKDYLNAFVPTVFNNDFVFANSHVHTVAVKQYEHKIGNSSSKQWPLISAATEGYRQVVSTFSPQSSVVLMPRLIHNWSQDDGVL